MGGSWGGLRKTAWHTLVWLLFATLGFSFGYLVTRSRRSGPTTPDPIATAPRAATTAGGPTTVIPADVVVPEGMVLIPGGEFTMGTDATEAWEDEKPSHPVVVDPFLIDIHEVTNTQFATKHIKRINPSTTRQRVITITARERIIPNTPL